MSNEVSGSEQTTRTTGYNDDNYLDYYIDMTTPPPDNRVSLYDEVEKNYKDKWENQVHRGLFRDQTYWEVFQEKYNYYLTQYQESHIDNADRRMAELQDIENQAAKLRGNEAKAEYLYDDDELYNRIRQEAYDESVRNASDAAALMALNEMSNYDNTLPSDAGSTMMEDAAANSQKNEMEEIIEQLNAREPEYLVRGAPLKCQCGSHVRFLDMKEDHGVRVQGKPLMYVKDNVIDENIKYFGHCTSVSPPPEAQPIRLAQYVPATAEGNILESQEESTKVDLECIPKIIGPWKNGFVQTKIASPGGVYYNTITTQSYLLCAHGGVIYPIDNGQRDYTIYIPPFAACPFPPSDSEDSLFRKWCDKNDVCPHLPGTPEYDSWYKNKINPLAKDCDQKKAAYKSAEHSYEEAKTNTAYINAPNQPRAYDLYLAYNKYGQAKTDYEASQKKVDDLYNEWLGGMVGTGNVDRNTSSLPQSSEDIRASYHEDNIPTIRQEIGDFYTRHGSVGQ